MKFIKSKGNFTVRGGLRGGDGRQTSLPLEKLGAQKYREHAPSSTYLNLFARSGDDNFRAIFPPTSWKISLAAPVINEKTKNEIQL